VIPLSLRTDGSLDLVLLGAHPDDIEIGAGGTLLNLARQFGSRLSVRALVLSGSDERAQETRRALGRFLAGAASVDVRVEALRDGFVPARWQEAKDALEGFARVSPAALVIAPNCQDAHQDHRALAELARTVWRNQVILGYEVPKFDGDLGQPSLYVPLDEATMQEKCTILAESFPSQRSKDWFDDETFKSLARLRGIECHVRYAEAFYATKLVLAL
jgi:LmbE family N-acetylglucosaminyl deacetylase